MSAQTLPTPQNISIVTKFEGGSSKGSEAAQLQSQLAEQNNFEQVAQGVLSKMQNHPDLVTADGANHLKSSEARLMGIAQPPKSSISSDAQRLAASNERDSAAKPSAAALNTATTTSSTTAPPTASATSLSPEEQSHMDKENNFKAAAAEIGDKIANHPGAVTQDDAKLLHSREQRAHGHTEKGGIAAQAQHLAAGNAAKKEEHTTTENGHEKGDIAAQTQHLATEDATKKEEHLVTEKASEKEGA